MGKLSIALLAALALSACATGRIDDASKLELYRAHAGEPVNSFRFLGSLQSWTALGDEAVAVWVRNQEAYLLEFFGPCYDISFAHTIGLTSTNGQVSASFDKVLLPNQAMPCQIRTIRPLDTRAIKAGERELRETLEAPASAQEEGSGT